MSGRQVQRAQFLDIAFHEGHVAFCVTEAFPVPVQMLARDGELLGRGIDAGDRAALSDHLREDIGVLSAARSKVEDMRALDRLRSNETATVIAGPHVLVHVHHRLQDGGRRGLCRAARIGFQVRRPFQHAAVIILTVFQIHVTTHPSGSKRDVVGMRAFAWRDFWLQAVYKGRI